MVAREEIEWAVREIKENPTLPWVTSYRELYSAVWDEIRDEFPDALALAKSGTHYILPTKKAAARLYKQLRSREGRLMESLGETRKMIKLLKEVRG